MTAPSSAQVRALLTEHYRYGADVMVEVMEQAHGSTNQVVVIRISHPERLPVEVIVRRRDSTTPQYEPELPMVEAAVRRAAAAAGLVVDEVIPTRDGANHARRGRWVYSLHRRLPGEALTWPRWASFQTADRVPEVLGGLQALWDDRLGRVGPDELLAMLPVHEWELLGGTRDPVQAVAATFVHQDRPGARLDLMGRTNSARFSWAAREILVHSERLPRYAALFNVWAARFDEWSDQFDASTSPIAAKWLQHGDPSPMNTFFLPTVDDWQCVAGLIDYELVRFSPFRSDLGVAASLRFGDTPTDDDLARVRRGRRTGRALDLNLLERYLTGYLALAPQAVAARGYTSGLADEIVRGLQANVLGLILWSARMAEAGLLTDAAMSSYLATQIHRYGCRQSLTAQQIEDVLRSARLRAPSLLGPVNAALAQATFELAP